MSNTPFMPLWVADFVGDTLDLDAKEIGAYMLILMTMWGRDGYLPNDEKKLQRVARCGRDWPRVWGAISHYFRADGDRITQDRVLRELQKVVAKRLVSSQQGARGGRAKALNLKRVGLANATVSLQQPEPYLEQKEKEAYASSKKSPLIGRGTRLASEWTIPPEWLAWAMAEGMVDHGACREAERFRDYWLGKPGKDGVKLDWQATWRNWVRKAMEDARPARRSAQPQIGDRRNTKDGRVIEYAGENMGWITTWE